ncbi:YhfT family protein [Paenibacillus taiwanensis]|uniref:YhfT family protein n=1 Tax=Paenibacillus taiwanensis TaxID=401638 RepID=UPI000425D756|nr:YhfT family protein [Paenibacillus taiwanensis]
MLNMMGSHMAVQLCIVSLLCALTAYLSHCGRAAFNDGVRPLLAEQTAGRMSRQELAGRSYRLSVGFVLTLGLSFALSYQLLNPWLLFLATDALGVYASRKRTALLLGALWGGGATMVIHLVPLWLHALPIPLFDSLRHVTVPVLAAVVIVPFLAILQQFGRSKLIASMVVVVGAAIIYYAAQGKSFSLTDVHIAEFAAPTLALGLVMLVAIGYWRDRKGIQERRAVAEQMLALHADSYTRMKKLMPLFAVIGGLVSLCVHMQWLAGTELSAPLLHDMWSEGGAAAGVNPTIVAAAEWMRALCFVPLLVTTTLATGVYGVVGLTLVYPVGYLAPDPISAVVLGAGCIVLEMLLLRRMALALYLQPTVRESADYLRSALNTMLELGMLFGGMLAVLRMNTQLAELGLLCYMFIYVINEVAGRPVMRLAIGPIAAILTALLLNVWAYLSVW